MKTLFTLAVVSSLSAVLFLQTSCGPTEKVVYSYKPPQTSEGRHCVNNCLINKTQCDEECERQSTVSKVVGTITNLIPGQTPSRIDPSFERQLDQQREDNNKASCMNRCAGDYRMCYTNCGGTVTSKVIQQ